MMCSVTCRGMMKSQLTSSQPSVLVPSLHCVVFGSRNAKSWFKMNPRPNWRERRDGRTSTVTVFSHMLISPRGHLIKCVQMTPSHCENQHAKCGTRQKTQKTMTLFSDGHESEDFGSMEMFWLFISFLILTPIDLYGHP